MLSGCSLESHTHVMGEAPLYALWWVLGSGVVPTASGCDAAAVRLATFPTTGESKGLGGMDYLFLCRMSLSICLEVLLRCIVAKIWMKFRH